MQNISMILSSCFYRKILKLCFLIFSELLFDFKEWIMMPAAEMTTSAIGGRGTIVMATIKNVFSKVSAFQFYNGLQNLKFTTSILIARNL